MISRIEALVLNILGEKEELFNPQSRIEEILYSILQDTAYIKNPLSRIEAILLAIKNSDEYTRNALSRVEEILLAFKNGTNDYDKLPQSDIERDLIRFLGEWVTKSGSIVSYDTDQVTPPLKKLEVKMEPVQDLNGYDSPWPGGGGKNLFDASTVPTTTLNGVTCVNNGDGSFTINGTATGTSDTFFNLFRSQFNTNFGGTPLPSAEYRLTGVPSGAGSSAFYVYTTPSYIADMGDGRTFTNTITGGAIYIKSGTTVNNVTIWPMIRLASNGNDTFSPYSNICPISGRTSATIYHSGADTSNPTEYEIPFSTEVYGGKLNVETGECVVDKKSVYLNNPNLWESRSGTVTLVYNSSMFSDRKKYSTSYDGFICSYYGINRTGTETARWTGATSNYFGINSTAITLEQIKADAIDYKVQVVYELANPITLTLTPVEIRSLLGRNNIWSDAGDVTVCYHS